MSYCENFVASRQFSTSIIWIFDEPNTLDLMSCPMVVYNQQQTFFVISQVMVLQVGLRRGWNGWGGISYNA